MTIRVAINGFGRIGRNILHALYENYDRDDIQIVAINDLNSIEINAHLLKYDSVHGIFPGEIKALDHHIEVDGDAIELCAHHNPKDLPWKALEIDVVLECTGCFTTKEKAQIHLEAGAKKVLISAPSDSEVKTIVYGVNEKTLSKDDTIVSNASCTTNCLAPLIKPLHEHLGIKSGLMTTIHAYTNDQKITDAAHSDIRRARSATQSMIPTQTGAAKSIGLVLPELAGKLDGFAIRVPTINVSAVDFTFEALEPVSEALVNNLIKQASKTDLKGILGCCDIPLVSIDFNHNPLSSILDASLTKVTNHLVKVVAWYDNEWGFSNRMLDTTKAMQSC